MEHILFLNGKQLDSINDEIHAYIHDQQQQLFILSLIGAMHAQEPVGLQVKS